MHLSNGFIDSTRTVPLRPKFWINIHDELGSPSSRPEILTRLPCYGYSIWKSSVFQFNIVYFRQMVLWPQACAVDSSGDSELPRFQLVRFTVHARKPYDTDDLTMRKATVNNCRAAISIRAPYVYSFTINPQQQDA